MAQHLGAFGKAREEATSSEPDTFDWYGKTIRISDRLAGAPLFDYADAVVSGVDVGNMQAISATRKMVRSCIAEEDWAVFWELYESNRGTTEELAELSARLYEHLGGRPTDKPSDSSAGRSPIGSGTSGQSSTPQQPFVPLVTPGVNGQNMVLTPDGNGGYTASQLDSPSTSPTP